MDLKKKLLLEYICHSRFFIECTYLMADGDRQIVVVDQENPRFPTTYIHSKVFSLPNTPVKELLLRHEGLISDGTYDESPLSLN
ncbi:hypothetical protein GLW04_19335 [Halobacillus litoralis]|uniref:Uncharacterized protein n=1 Tax=Halobacillus litoralis TaxID=45668 RepID=A0A845DWI9_9BACI|nr:hypothetical protein [Halobacillus litoralis]MYL22031.1 hypothetical protein [Halobacillus litoralis]